MRCALIFKGFCPTPWGWLEAPHIMHCQTACPQDWTRTAGRAACGRLSWLGWARWWWRCCWWNGWAIDEESEWSWHWPRMKWTLEQACLVVEWRRRPRWNFLCVEPRWCHWRRPTDTWRDEPDTFPRKSTFCCSRNGVAFAHWKKENQSIKRTLKSIHYSMNQSIDQSTKKSMDQSNVEINKSINCWLYPPDNGKSINQPMEKR